LELSCERCKGTLPERHREGVTKGVRLLGWKGTGRERAGLYPGDLGTLKKEL